MHKIFPRSTFSGPEHRGILLLPNRVCKYLLNRSNQATVFWSWYQDVGRSISSLRIIGILLLESTTALQMRTFSLFTSGSVAWTSSQSFGCTGQLFSSFQRDLGPLNHCCSWSQPRSVFIPWIPLDVRSAVFMSVGTCRQWLGVVLSWITCKRLATKVWNLLEVFLRYRSTIVESVQNTTRLRGNCNSLRIC